MLRKKRGEMGIGTLILFVAMLLVAAITAGVLIQTSESLQSQALLTANRAVKQVSTAITVLNVVAENGSTGNLTDFYYEIRLSGGSDALSFSDALLSFETSNGTIDLQYRAGDCVQGTGYITNADDTGYFTVQYILQGNNYKQGYLHRGDVARVCFESLDPVKADDVATIMFKPSIGFSRRTTFVVTSILANDRVHLFP